MAKFGEDVKYLGGGGGRNAGERFWWRGAKPLTQVRHSLTIVSATISVISVRSSIRENQGSVFIFHGMISRECEIFLGGCEKQGSCWRGGAKPASLAVMSLASWRVAGDAPDASPTLLAG